MAGFVGPGGPPARPVHHAGPCTMIRSARRTWRFSLVFSAAVNARACANHFDRERSFTVNYCVTR
jgi:hypothetical protein